MARFTSSLVKCRPSQGILNGSTVTLDVTEILVGTAVVGTCREVTWEDPSNIGLGGAGAEGGTCRTSDDEGSIMQGVRLD